jgi:hypothetical protein
VGDDVPVDSETLLVTDFVNLKIKPAQSFGGAHRGRVCVCVFIGVSARTCMSIYVYTVFLKKRIYFFHFEIDVIRTRNFYCNFELNFLSYQHHFKYGGSMCNFKFSQCTGTVV